MQNVKYVSDEDEESSEEEKVSPTERRVKFEESSSEDEIDEASAEGQESDYQHVMIKKESAKSLKRNDSAAPELSRMTSREGPEIEEIVKIFANDLQQAIRQRFKSKQMSTKDIGERASNQQAKNIPYEVQVMLGEANNLYAFKKHEEAIAILQKTLGMIPGVADPLITLSIIYEDLGNVQKSLEFGALAAYLVRTDVEKWRHCAEQARSLKKYHDAIYCLNRAIKQSSKSDIDDFLQMKFEKIEIYKLQNDFSSACRMLTKLIKKFESDPQRQLELNVQLAVVYHEQKSYQNCNKLLNELILLHNDNLKTLLDLLLLQAELAFQTGDTTSMVDVLQQNALIFEKESSDIEIQTRLTQLAYIREVVNSEKSGMLNLQRPNEQLSKTDMIKSIETYQKIVCKVLNSLNVNSYTGYDNKPI